MTRIGFAGVGAISGIYLENKFGVRIEDVVVLEENGCRNLMELSKELLHLVKGDGQDAEAILVSVIPIGIDGQSHSTVIAVAHQDQYRLLVLFGIHARRRQIQAQLENRADGHPLFAIGTAILIG